MVTRKTGKPRGRPKKPSAANAQRDRAVHALLFDSQNGLGLGKTRAAEVCAWLLSGDVTGGNSPRRNGKPYTRATAQGAVWGTATEQVYILNDQWAWAPIVVRSAARVFWWWEQWQRQNPEELEHLPMGMTARGLRSIFDRVQAAQKRATDGMECWGCGSVQGVLPVSRVKAGRECLDCGCIKGSPETLARKRGKPCPTCGTIVEPCTVVDHSRCWCCHVRLLR